jgi:hypothetical protein
MKTITKFTYPAFAALALACFALVQNTQAVSPPPDGGYPGANTAEGTDALFSLTSGIANTAVGFNALHDNTTGTHNVAIGSSALASNTTGSFNMAVGTDALRDNTASFNLAIGFRVGFMNTTGSHLTGIGAAALRNNTTGASNTAIGADALRENTTGFENTAIGDAALSNNDSAAANTAVGAFALFNSHTITAGRNTAIGWKALFNDTTGDENTAVGTSGFGGGPPLFRNTTGRFNTAVGGAALSNNTVGGDDTAVGSGALNDNVTGNENVAIGLNALARNTSGSNNVALGNYAGFNATTGSHNIYIGDEIEGSAGESNVCRIGSIFGQTAAGGSPVYIDANHQLGTLTSSKRFKENIQQMGTTSEALFALKPVSFRYKKEIDPAGISQFGLVAEDVEKVNPDLVARDRDGKPYTVRYDAVNAMMLNEFLKEHKAFVEEQRKVQEQGATIARQQRQIEALTAGLQKVTAQLELKKPAPQTALNSQ